MQISLNWTILRMPPPADIAPLSLLELITICKKNDAISQKSFSGYKLLLLPTRPSRTGPSPYMSNTPELSRILWDTQRSDSQEVRSRET